MVTDSAGDLEEWKAVKSSAKEERSALRMVGQSET